MSKTNRMKPYVDAMEIMIQRYIMPVTGAYEIAK